MKPIYSCLLFLTVIAAIIAIFECDTGGYDRADPLDITFLETDATSKPNLLPRGPNDQPNQSAFGQKTSTEPDTSTSQAQPVQPYEQSRLPASKENSNASSSEDLRKLKQWIRSNYLSLLAIIVPVVFGWRFVVWQVNKHRKLEIEDKVKVSFDCFPRHIRPEQKRNRATYRHNLYTGCADPEPMIYVSLKLDAERKLLKEVTSSMKEMRSKEWFHILIHSDRKQGKTIFMGRLANNLSQEKRWGFLRRKYLVLWSRQAKTPFRKNLENGDDLTPYVRLLSEYRRYYARRKRLLVVIDDFFRSDRLESEGIVELQTLKNFLRRLNEVGISVITSSSSEDARITESKAPYKLKFEKEDVGSILSKLVKENFISKRLKARLSFDLSGQRVYKKQLFAFFSFLLSQTEFKDDFIKGFEETFRELSSEEQLTLKTIALCQMVDIYLPQHILQKAFPNSFPRLQTGLGGLVRRERYRETDDDSYIYHMGGPFLAKWLLEEKFSVQNGDQLEQAFSVLFDLLLREDMLNKYSQVPIIVSLIFKRLAAGWHIAIFDIPGKPLANGLFCHFKDRLHLYLNTVTDPGNLVSWAATARYLGEYDVGTRLYRRASEKIQIPPGPPTVQNMRPPVSLAMGLSDMPDPTSRQLAVSWLEKIKEKYIAELGQSWLILKVVHKLSQTLNQLGQPQKALQAIGDLPPGLSPDALLLQIKGDLLESLGGLSEAQNSLKQSVENARPLASQNPQTLFNCLQHYADFLATYPHIAKKEGEDPEASLKEAKDLLIRADLEGYEALLKVRAKYKRNQGDISGAKHAYEECISHCRKNGFVHSHSWTDFAHFLLEHGAGLAKKTLEEWLSKAERLYREVIDCANVDVRSKRSAYHSLGLLVGSKTYRFDGNQRPNFQDAVNTLQNAFESPEPDRNDDNKKTFQDAITHRALKDVYLNWCKSIDACSEDANQLVLRVDFHFQRAFMGLPRHDLSSSQVIEHALLTEAKYAESLWRPWVGKANLNAAEEHYKAAIAKFEEFHHKWPEAYKLYDYYSIFLFETGRAKLPDIVALLYKTLKLVPDDKSEDTARISSKLAHNLHSDLLDNLRLVTPEDAGEKLDEIIRLFADTLKLKPGNEKAAVELSHVFFASGYGPPMKLITKTRVSEVKDILSQVWVARPNNKGALSGLLDISDTIIDKMFNDENTLKNLADLINQKAIKDKRAAQVLGDILIARKDSKFRGGLTDILLGLGHKVYTVAIFMPEVEGSRKRQIQFCRRVKKCAFWDHFCSKSAHF